MNIKNDEIDLILYYSLKCQTRTEFKTKYVKYYNLSRKLGVLDKVCEHMIIKSYSTPQLILKHITETIFKIKCSYNNRKLIKPYEIDILFESLKIAFEYDGERWHRNDRIDKSVLCDELNIKLITIKENSREYELDIKDQLINYLPLINEITKNNITDIDINSIKIDFNEIMPNLNKIKEICLKYDDISIFIKEENSLYKLLHKRKLLYEYTKHMNNSRTNYKNININEIINNYTDINTFIKNENKLYQHIMKNNKSYLLKDLTRETIIWTKELICDEIKKYTYLSDFKKNTKGCYNSAIKMGLTDELKTLKIKRTKYSMEYLKDVISTYTKLSDLIKNDYNLYTYCLNNNLKHLYSHLDKRKKWTIDELINVINKCKTIKELSINYPKEYSSIRKNHKHLLENLKKYIK